MTAASAAFLQYIDCSVNQYNHIHKVQCAALLRAALLHARATQIHSKPEKLRTRATQIHGKG